MPSTNPNDFVPVETPDPSDLALASEAASAFDPAEETVTIERPGKAPLVFLVTELDVGARLELEQHGYDQKTGDVLPVELYTRLVSGSVKNPTTRRRVWPDPRVVRGLSEKLVRPLRVAALKVNGLSKTETGESDVGKSSATPAAAGSDPSSL